MSKNSAPTTGWAFESPSCLTWLPQHSRAALLIAPTLQVTDRFRASSDCLSRRGRAGGHPGLVTRALPTHAAVVTTGLSHRETLAPAFFPRPPPARPGRPSLSATPLSIPRGATSFSSAFVGEQRHHHVSNTLVRLTREQVPVTPVILLVEQGHRPRKFALVQKYCF